MKRYAEHRKLFPVVLVAAATLFLTGCVSQSEYDKLLNEKMELEENYQQLANEYSSIETKYNDSIRDNEELEKENRALQDENKSLTDKVDAISDENTSLVGLLERAYALMDEDADEIRDTETDQDPKHLNSSDLSEEMQDGMVSDSTGIINRPNESIDAEDEYAKAKEKIVEGYEKTKKAATEIGADVTRDVLDAFVTGDRDSAEELRKDIKDEFKNFGINMKNLFKEQKK